jgi:hypothetical protein
MRLQTTIIAADTQSTPRINGRVTQVPGGAIDSVQNYAIDQHGSANAGAKRQHDHISSASGSAPKHFANQRDASVILSADGKITSADGFAQELAFEEVQVAR